MCRKYAIKYNDVVTGLDYIEYFANKTKANQAIERNSDRYPQLYKYVDKWDKFILWSRNSPEPITIGRTGKTIMDIENKCFVVEDE